jgi:hypothetical protein
MKYTSLIFAFLLLLSASLSAQDVTTVKAKDSDISDNLDLEAVASVFMDAENLEDFERQLNDPEKKLSNLDLNGDGYVDYLRVIEAANKKARVITIQAVIGKDLYQDVATIDVELDDEGETQVQVVGDVFMYGNDYVIQPVFVQRPRIFVYLWAPRPVLWISPFYWDYYPSYWSYWGPYPYSVYWSRVHVYRYYTFNYYSYPRSVACATLHRSVRRDDYAMRHPGEAFSQRTDGFRNKSEFDKERGLELSKPGVKGTDTKVGRPVESEWKPDAEKEGRPSKVIDNKVTVPNTERDVNDRPADMQKPVKVDPKDTQKPEGVRPVKVDPKDTQKPNDGRPVKVDPKGTEQPSRTTPSKPTDKGDVSSPRQEKVTPTKRSESSPRVRPSKRSTKDSRIDSRPSKSSTPSRSNKTTTPVKDSSKDSSSGGKRK